jgi:cathepsin L
MKLFLALTLFLACAFALSERQTQTAFSQWMHQNKKSYGHEEFRQRYAIFKKNLNYITAYNARNTGTTLAMNKFGDLSNNEFQLLFLGFRMDLAKQQPWVATFKNEGKPLDAGFDWRTKGAVTPIKNQGQCGSCWSFSTTGSTEGCHQITTGKLVSLSEQNLVDCSNAQGDEGCNGGLMTDAMTYIIQNGGIDTESSYPYTAEDGTCAYNAQNSGATLKAFTNVAAGDENALQQSCAMGPVSVAIDASHDSFQFYSSGVYYEPDCSTSQLDHGVLAIGWGTDSTSGSDYWIVKNSWGTDWGQEGFIWMSRNKQNNCGIATMATLPQC